VGRVSFFRWGESRSPFTPTGRKDLAVSLFRALRVGELGSG